MTAEQITSLTIAAGAIGTMVGAGLAAYNTNRTRKEVTSGNGKPTGEQITDTYHTIQRVDLKVDQLKKNADYVMRRSARWHRALLQGHLTGQPSETIQRRILEAIFEEDDEVKDQLAP